MNAGVLRGFNLQRVERVLRAIGDPHKRVPAVHIAGTKGKGSTATFIYRVLLAAGHAAGLYTQPHLVSPRERFQARGACITKPEMAAAKVRAGAHFVVTGNVLEGDGSALLLQEFSRAVHGAAG